MLTMATGYSYVLADRNTGNTVLVQQLVLVHTAVGDVSDVANIILDGLHLASVVKKASCPQRKGISGGLKKESRRKHRQNP